MKRFLIRMSALATVVVLGLVAIALAQRGVDDSPAVAAELDRSTSAPASGDASDAVPTPIDVVGQPPVFPTGDALNPLRHDTGSIEPRDTAAVTGQSTSFGPGYTVAASAEPAKTHPTSNEPAESGFGGQVPWGPTVDPFTAGGGTSNIDAGTAEPALIEGTPPVVVAADTPNAPPYEGAGHYSQLGLPATVDPPMVAAPVGTAYPDLTAGSIAGPSYPESTADDGYPLSPVVTADVGAPGHFQPDPSMPSASIPPSSIAADTGLQPYGAGVASMETAGTGKPGSTQLEGLQTPQLTVQKIAPEEIQVGKAATFQVKVVNSGQTAAQGVEIRDEIPKGTRLISTDPPASRGARGELVWTLGTMKPGDESSVEVQLMPTAEGEIGSVATVHFQADAAVRTIATKPELVIKTSAPRQVLIGGEVTFSITISNPGSGVATSVVLEEHVPVGLHHVAGSELEYAIGDLAPDESRQLELTMQADQPGKVTNVLIARDDAALSVEDCQELEVIAPQLDVSIAGPKRRYLEREATYLFSISNSGTAPARDVELVAHLPVGLEFVSADKNGRHQEATRTVRWNLVELPVEEADSVRLVTMPIEAGEQTLRISGADDTGHVIEKEQPVLIEGIAAILFQVVDVDDPIELGGETTYEIRVLNQGSKAATNVQLVAVLPPQMRPVAAEGPARHAMEGNRIVFDGLPRLAPKADTTFRVRVQGLQPGDLRMHVQLLTDEIDDWVTKEESTRVYSDE